MNIFIRVFSVVWTIYCGLVFALVALVCFPLLPLAIWSNHPWLIKKAHRLPHYAARVVLFLWGVRVKVHNESLIHPEKQYVFAGNHRSDLDAILASYIMPGYYKYIGKAEILNWPILGYLLKHFYISVNRGDKNSRKESMEEMRKKALDGASIIVFPEGWSNFSNDYLLPFKKGAFRLATDTGLPIAVFTIVGASEIWPKPFVRVWPGTVHVYWEGVIPVQKNDSEAYRNELMAEVATLMTHRLKQAYPDGMKSKVYNSRRFEKWKANQMKKLKERKR